MSFSLKSKKDIEKMKIAGRKAANILEMLTEYVVPGVTTGELDDIAFKFIPKSSNVYQLILAIVVFQKLFALQSIM